MNTSMVDRKAFDAAWETMGWDNQNPLSTDVQERFVAAYLAAKDKSERKEKTVACLMLEIILGTTLFYGLSILAIGVTPPWFVGAAVGIGAGWVSVQVAERLLS